MTELADEDLHETCPPGCGRQDCAPDEPGSIVIHDSRPQYARAVIEDAFIDVGVTIEEAGTHNMGMQRRVVMRFPTEASAPACHGIVVELGLSAADRLAELLRDAAALLRDRDPR